MPSSFLGRDTFPRIWIWICIIFNWVGILALVILGIAEVVLIFNNYRNYVHYMRYSYPARHYPSDVAGNGFVEHTNAPKHLGSAIWMLFFQISIILFAMMAVASDFGWRNTSINAYGTRYVEMFYAEGIMKGTRNIPFFYYVVANGFLKLYIVVMYMSQSFYGMSGGSHAAPFREDSFISSGSTSGSDSGSGSGHITFTGSLQPSTVWTASTNTGPAPAATTAPRHTVTGIWSGSGSYTGAVGAAVNTPSATVLAADTHEPLPSGVQLGGRSVDSDTHDVGYDDLLTPLHVHYSELQEDIFADFIAMRHAQAQAQAQEGSVVRVRRDLIEKPRDPEAIYGTEAWAYWMGWIVLGSIVPSVIAFIFLGTRERVEQEKKDAEAAAARAAEKRAAEKAATAKKADKDKARDGEGGGKDRKGK